MDEKKRIIILIGFIEVLLVNWVNTSFIGTNWKIKRIEAPTKEIIQNVEMLILPILIFGKKRIDSVIVMNVRQEITRVAIIKHNRYYTPFLLKVYIFLI